MAGFVSVLAVFSLLMTMVVTQLFAVVHDLQSQQVSLPALRHHEYVHLDFPDTKLWSSSHSDPGGNLTVFLFLQRVLMGDDVDIHSQVRYFLGLSCSL